VCIGDETVDIPQGCAPDGKDPTLLFTMRCPNSLASKTKISGVGINST
jgi:hypothetical protein